MGRCKVLSLRILSRLHSSVSGDVVETEDVRKAAKEEGVDI